MTYAYYITDYGIIAAADAFRQPGAHLQRFAKNGALIKCSNLQSPFPAVENSCEMSSRVV